MKACCATCAFRYDLQKTDFTKLKTAEPIDTDLEGYICMGFAYERVAIWLVGNDPQKGICEMYSPIKRSQERSK